MLTDVVVVLATGQLDIVAADFPLGRCLSLDPERCAVHHDVAVTLLCQSVPETFLDLRARANSE